MVWHGLPDEFVCVGRPNVVAVLCEQVPINLDIEAIELVGAERRVIVGTRSEHLPRPPDGPHAGQIYNVFEPRELRFVAIHDFARRDEALRFAGIDCDRQWC